MDEAAAQLKMEITSKPAEETIDRRLMQLEMEKLSLAEDKHATTTRDRLERMEQRSPL